jgi:hypothetical protein
MENTFLTEEQQLKLNRLDWSVVPDGAFITLYNDEIAHRAWCAICEQLGVSPEVESVMVLYVGVQ